MFAPYLPSAHGVPDPAVLVRPARSDDMPGIVAVASSRGPLPEGWSARMSEHLTPPDWTVLVAVDRDVVGWAMLGPWDADPPGRYVSGLTVAPWARRRGIGDRLLAEMLAGESTVFSVINTRNGASLDLHRRHGFTEVARAARIAGVSFEGGSGVLLRRDRKE